MNTPQRHGRSLRMMLGSRTVLGIGLPVVLSGAIAFFFLSYQLELIEASFDRSRHALAHDVAGADLRAQAENAARQLDAFLLERMVEARAWASAPLVVEAAMSAHGRHVAEGLTEAPIEAVEARFRIQKSLGAAPQADTYLRQQIAASPYFAEVFFTDRNGYNVALTNPTSDFVQSDEDWWQSAWSRGLSVGEIEYDDSAGVWSIDISLRIADPDSEQPVGVMKTVLAIEPVQRVADRTAQTIAGGRVQIATGRGVLIAETSSGHARERIMNPEIDLQAQGEPSVRAAFGADRAGFSADDEWLAGYARTGGRDTYAGVTERFAGFDWVVVLQRPVAGITDAITALATIEEAMRDWRLMLLVVLVATALVSILVALALALGAAHRLSASMQAIREMAERSASGQPAIPATIERPVELAQLNDAVNRLCQVLITVLRRSQHRQSRH